LLQHPAELTSESEEIKLIDEDIEVYNDKGSRGTQVCHKRRDKTKKLRDSIAYYAIVYLNHKFTNFGC